MGQRGPAPAPAALKILRGDPNKARIERAPQPMPPPTRPEGMTAEAVIVWDRILEAISLTSHIGQPHAEALRQYAELTVTINAMHPKGSKEWRELVLVHLRLARELCLTQATSTNLIRRQPTQRKLDRFLA